MPRGARVVTGYAPIHRIRMASRERLAVGDVERAYRRLLCLPSGAQAWPCPVGYWESIDSYVVVDGRHQYVAALMLGYEWLLVAWMEGG